MAPFSAAIGAQDSAEVNGNADASLIREAMPEISRFFGIVISMYYSEHAPPHFHARYGDERASIRIDDGEILEGSLGRRALRLVEEWRALHVAELQNDWQHAQVRAPLSKIEPLG